eukprot:Awhi_evm1s2675
MTLKFIFLNINFNRHHVNYYNNNDDNNPKHNYNYIYVSSGNSGNSLAVCSGGCRGLARYCSSEHQRKHWDSHKIICKFSEDDNNNNYNNNNAKR